MPHLEGVPNQGCNGLEKKRSYKTTTTTWLALCTSYPINLFHVLILCTRRPSTPPALCCLGSNASSGSGAVGAAGGGGLFEESSAAGGGTKMMSGGGVAGGGGHHALMPADMAPADDFPEDLNGIPLANLTNTSLDGKVEPYLGFGSPSVSSAHHNGTGGGGIGGFPSNTPSTSSDSAGTVVAEQHQNGGGCVGGGGGGGGRSSSGSSSGCHRLVIRDPFDDDEDEQQHNQQQQQHLLNNFAMPSSWFTTSTPCRPPLLDGRTWMEQVRANGGGELRPLVPAPGNGAPVAALPQYAFHMTPMQRQRLEAMYPPGTFSSTYFRTAPMPPPRALMPPQMPRFVLMPIRPGATLPPHLAAAARTGPGQTPCLPMPLICGPGGLPMAVFPGGLVPIHPQMLVGAPPMMPGVGGAPPQIQTPHQQQQQAGTSSGVGKQQLNTSGGSTASSTATNTATTKESKPKRETIKVRKARQAAEKAAAEQQQLRQHEAAMAAAAAAAAVGMQQGPLAGVRSPCDGAVFPGAAPPPPSMMMGGTPTPYGTMPAGNIMQQQQHQMMCHQQQQLNPCLNPPHTPQQQQQDAIFKVPGRSPSSLKRASLPPPAPPPSSMFPPSALMPMPEQRIQLNGQCQACRGELSDQHKGIQCTAIGQGCNRVFHWACADLTLEAFQEFCKDPRRPEQHQLQLITTTTTKKASTIKGQTSHQRSSINQ
uniref:PHD-type domain-containing protein n=2 Tax=Globodera TaxID=31242 RepID=A0A914HGW2_GLORO